MEYLFYQILQPFDRIVWFLDFLKMLENEDWNCLLITDELGTVCEEEHKYCSKSYTVPSAILKSVSKQTLKCYGIWHIQIPAWLAFKPPAYLVCYHKDNPVINCIFQTINIGSILCTKERKIQKVIEVKRW